MGFRFRKSFKIAPGIRMNVGTRGASFTLGGRGASINVGSRGVYGNLGIPGTGISYRERLDKPSPSYSGSSSTQLVDVAVRVSLANDGSLVLKDENGNILPNSVVRAARRQLLPSIQSWLEESCNEINAAIEACRTLHLKTPAPHTISRDFLWQAFDEKPPVKPIPKEPSFWQRLFSSLRQKVEAENQAALDRYETALRAWELQKQQHEAAQDARRKLFDEARSGHLDRMEELLAEVLSKLEWPRETSVNFQLMDPQTLYLDVDLPEIEDMPSQEARVAAKGDRLVKKDLSQTAIRKNYMEHVHGIGFRLVGEAFAALPTLQAVVVSAYSQRPDKKTGHINDEYLYSVRVTRDNWAGINFGQLEILDVVEALTQFELRRDMTKTGIFKPVEPFDLVT